MTPEQDEALQAGLAEAVGYVLLIVLIGGGMVLASHAFAGQVPLVFVNNATIGLVALALMMSSALVRWVSRRHLFGITRPRAPWRLLFGFARWNPEYTRSSGPAWHTDGDQFYWPGIGFTVGHGATAIAIIHLLARLGEDSLVFIASIWASPLGTVFMILVTLANALLWNRLPRNRF